MLTRPGRSNVGTMEGVLVGNDVVDLADPRCHGKARDARFVERVFSPEEASVIREADMPDRALWVLWAAKEAGFKVISKILGSPPPFAHARFTVQVSSTARPRVSGRVTYGQTAVPLVANVRPDRIHAVAWNSPGVWDAEPMLPASVAMAVETVEGVLEGRGSQLEALLEAHFTDRERRSVHSLPSAAVRIAARLHVARTLVVDVGDVEIVCEGAAGRTPPKLLVPGAREADVSLSHDGALVAWAVALPTAGSVGS